MLRSVTDVTQFFCDVTQICKHYADIQELRRFKEKTQSYSHYVMDSSSLMQTRTVRAASQEVNLISRPSVSKALVRILKLSLKVIDVVPLVALDSCALRPQAPALTLLEGNSSLTEQCPNGARSPTSARSVSVTTG
jgi:hypothetical protein